MLQPGVCHQEALCPASGTTSAWHAAPVMTVAQEGAVLFKFPLLHLFPLPALGKISGITKKVQPWTNPPGTAIHPHHHPS